MHEYFKSLRKGVRLYNANFYNGLAEEWRDRFASEEGQALVQDLEERGMTVRYAQTSGLQKDGSPFTRLNLQVGRLDHPVTEDDRTMLRESFPVDKVHFGGGFPETAKPLGPEWQVLYASTQRQRADVPANLKQEIEETLAPHVDRDVPTDHIRIANTAATLNTASGGEITPEMVEERFQFADKLWKMRASGFYRIIDCDMDDLHNPLIIGEYETFDEAMEQVREQIEDERQSMLHAYQEAQAVQAQDSEEWRSLQKYIDELKAGMPRTSSILYLYGPDGSVLQKYSI